MQARDLRIGDKIGAGKDPARVTNLHELCARAEGPHVHAVTTRGDLCMGFAEQVPA